MRLDFHRPGKYLSSWGQAECGSLVAGQQIQPRSGGGEVSPGRKARVDWEIDPSRVAAGEVLPQTLKLKALGWTTGLL
jgi:hypothetical protein